MVYTIMSRSLLSHADVKTLVDIGTVLQSGDYSAAQHQIVKAFEELKSTTNELERKISERIEEQQKILPGEQNSIHRQVFLTDRRNVDLAAELNRVDALDENLKSFERDIPKTFNIQHLSDRDKKALIDIKTKILEGNFTEAKEVLDSEFKILNATRGNLKNQIDMRIKRQQPNSDLSEGNKLHEFMQNPINKPLADELQRSDELSLNLNKLQAMIPSSMPKPKNTN